MAAANLAAVLRDLERPEESLAVARELVERHPNFALGHLNLCLSLDAVDSVGNEEEALAALDRACDLGSARALAFREAVAAEDGGSTEPPAREAADGD